jgi:hypothetical protein
MHRIIITVDVPVDPFEVESTQEFSHDQVLEMAKQELGRELAELFQMPVALSVSITPLPDPGASNHV